MSEYPKNTKLASRFIHLLTLTSEFSSLGVRHFTSVCDFWLNCHFYRAHQNTLVSTVRTTFCVMWCAFKKHQGHISLGLTTFLIQKSEPPSSSWLTVTIVTQYRTILTRLNLLLFFFLFIATLFKMTFTWMYDSTWRVHLNPRCHHVFINASESVSQPLGDLWRSTF